MSLAVCSLGVTAPVACAQGEGPASAPVVTAQSVEAETIRAAQANAVQNLYTEVARLPLSGEWTVGSFLTAIDAQDEFLNVLEGASQVGGPRWVNETVQVQLGMSTAVINQKLTQLAQAKKKSPLR